MRILIPTDFSRHSEIALELALQIANKKEDQITLLNVFDVPELSDSWIQNEYDHSWEEVLESTRVKIKERMAILSKKYSPNIKVKGQMVAGSPLGEILTFQKEGGFDLLILGVKKNNDIGSYLFGTFTDRLVHKSSIPVLIIKESKQISEIKKVVIGHEFKVQGTELKEIINTIRSLTASQIELLRVNTPSDFMSEDVFDARVEGLKKIEELKNCAFTSINFKTPGDGLLYHAAKNKFDMIVIGDKHSSTIRRWVLGEDLAEQVMDYSSLPVLIF